MTKVRMTKVSDFGLWISFDIRHFSFVMPL